MKTLILGGTNFVGPFVVRELVELGHEVTTFHRGETEQDLPPNVRHVHGDFADFNKHVHALRGISPEVVLDMVPFRGGRVRSLFCCNRDHVPTTSPARVSLR